MTNGSETTAMTYQTSADPAFADQPHEIRWAAGVVAHHGHDPRTHKILAIKAVRIASGGLLGLKEAKDLVESVAAAMPDRNVRLTIRREVLERILCRLVNGTVAGLQDRDALIDAVDDSETRMTLAYRHDTSADPNQYEPKRYVPDMLPEDEHFGGTVDPSTILPKPCWHCDRDAPVTWREDPYASEIEDDHTKRWLCDDCAEASAKEV